MRKIKKMLALVIAMVMIVGTMNMAVFAAAGDLTPTTPIKITGLETGDQVTLYKVIEWESGTGWKLTSAFSGLSDDVFTRIKAGTLEEADVKAITDIVNASGFSGTDVGGTTTDKYFEKAMGATDAGMYIALIKPIKAGTLYNPIIVSSNYKEDGNNEIDSSEMLGETSIAKREDITVTKTATEYTHDAGDEVTFTITTTIPAYADVYTEPFFTVSDTMSTGLVFKEITSVTTDPTVTYATPTTSDTGFTINFESSSIAALASPSSVTIVYKATLTTDAPTDVNEEENTVTVRYSNNPNDKTGAGVLKDGTNHYTFDIDGNLFGDSSYRTGELVKIGVDENDSEILEYKELSNESSHAALAGATFGLYTDSAATVPYKNKIGDTEYTWDHIESDANGLLGMDGMTGIKGLDEGDYYLKELTAPNGYIKDTHIYHINISAVVEDVDVTETLEGQTVTYKVPTLKSYKITVDGTESSYTMTLSGPSVESVTPGDSSTEIVNTKGVELPSTGGMGTTLFYIIGAVLVLGAGILLVTRRRMSAN